MPRVTINSILGGQSPSNNFSKENQFRASLGIDPALASYEGGSHDGRATISSGLLRPAAVKSLGGTTLNAAPMWIVSNPKDANVYVYDYQGSVYSAPIVNPVSLTGIGDGGNENAPGTGNGAEYYDNYIYFARNTTIARYGPLNGSPTLVGDYWGGVLGKTALSNTAYPSDTVQSISLPNHILHRHSDGRLYIADVVGNQGTIHYISTTKTTVEGDTDNGSTYNKVQVGYGLWPTAIESYGSDLAIAFYEGNNTQGKQKSAKLAFWDTTSQSINKITWVEFPDPLISGMKNVNGVLYVVGQSVKNTGLRLYRFIGGYSFEQVFTLDGAGQVFPGGVDASGKRIIFGCYNVVPEASMSVFSYGLNNSSLVNGGIFNTTRSSQNVGAFTSLLFISNKTPLIGVDAGAGARKVEWIPVASSDYSNSASVWWSQTYKTGLKFKITKVRIPLANTVSTNTIITPTIYTDDGNGTTYVGGVANGLPIINSANYSGKKSIVMRPENLTGDNNFWLELRWTGVDLATVSLPIIIDYEVIPD